jgi:hypothetical protein
MKWVPYLFTGWNRKPREQEGPAVSWPNRGHGTDGHGFQS